MLLILSENQDQSTNFVIDWLLFSNILFSRVNGDIDFLHCEINISRHNEVTIEIENREKMILLLNQFTSFWYRRNNYTIVSPIVKTLKRHVAFALKKEWLQIQQFIHYYFNDKKKLGSFEKENTHNKLISMAKASEAGFDIPLTLITTKKESLLEFLSINEGITKAIWNMFTIKTTKLFQSISTKAVKQVHTIHLSNILSPVLIQKNISKAYELRIFFIKEDIYSMAIFSQTDTKTQIDFRNYNRQKPTRNIPFSLPSIVKNRVLNFIKTMDLDTGSIDIIVTPTNEFVFLEVNPIGQFGWVSTNCNYYLEEKIANYFIN